MNQYAAAPARDVEFTKFGFTGKSGEYFRIWVVNTCLTVITLGIYSPWAKVRRNKYLYRHSHLGEGSFDYHANPVTILKGRLIAVSISAAYLLATFFAPLFSVVIALLIAAASPWLLVRSRMFAMHYTSYRNVRFGFPPVYKPSYKLFLKYTLITIITLGIGYAWFRAARARLIVDHTRFGARRMKLGEEVSGDRFFGVYFVASIVLFALIFVFSFVGVMLGLTPAQEDIPGAAADPATLFFTLVSLLAYILVFTGVAATTQRLIFNGATVDGKLLRCDWSIIHYVFIVMTNYIAIALSVGLLTPWATIRLQRYKLSRISILARESDLANVAAGESAEVSALGDEVGEAFDYDFGL